MLRSAARVRTNCCNSCCHVIERPSAARMQGAVNRSREATQRSCSSVIFDPETTKSCCRSHALSAIGDCMPHSPSVAHRIGRDAHLFRDRTLRRRAGEERRIRVAFGDGRTLSRYSEVDRSLRTMTHRVPHKCRLTSSQVRLDQGCGHRSTSAAHGSSRPCNSAQRSHAHACASAAT